MSAAVNLFDGAICAFEQVAPINETVMMARPSIVFRIVPLVSFLLLIHARRVKHFPPKRCLTPIRAVINIPASPLNLQIGQEAANEEAKCTPAFAMEPCNE